MQLVKKNNREYWVNDNGLRHGEYKWWHENGQIREHCFYVNHVIHGEYKWWWDDGTLMYHGYWDNGELVSDLIEEPVTDEDKFLLALEFGGKWLT